MNIELEKTSDATQIKCGTVYNYGTLKVGDHEYPFTIEEMVNDNPWWIKSEITWAEDTPPNHEEAEEAIMLKFEQLGAPAQGGGQAATPVADRSVASEGDQGAAHPSRNPDTQRLKVDGANVRWEGPRLTGIAPDFAPQMIDSPLFATNLTAHNAEELVRRWNAHNAMLAALEAICDLPADDQGQRTIPAGYLDQARTAIEQATK